MNFESESRSYNLDVGLPSEVVEAMEDVAEVLGECNAEELADYTVEELRERGVRIKDLGMGFSRWSQLRDLLVNPPEFGELEEAADKEDEKADKEFEVTATALLPHEVEKTLAPLNQRERQILALRFGLDRGEPRTLEEVGKFFHLTREEVRQIESAAMAKLRFSTTDQM